MSKAQAKLVNSYYMRDDGALMIEVAPGQFISETAARLGLVHPNMRADIERIRSKLKLPAGKKTPQEKARR